MDGSGKQRTGQARDNLSILFTIAQLALCDCIRYKTQTHSFQTSKLIPSLQINDQGVLANRGQQDATTGIQRRRTTCIDGPEGSRRLEGGFDNGFGHDVYRSRPFHAVSLIRGSKSSANFFLNLQCLHPRSAIR